MLRSGVLEVCAILQHMIDCNRHGMSSRIMPLHILPAYLHIFRHLAKNLTAQSAHALFPDRLLVYSAQVKQIRKRPLLREPLRLPQKKALFLYSPAAI